MIEPFVFEDSEGVEQPIHDRCGNVVLVALGAGWCVACREEMPELATWQSAYGDSGFAVYYVINQDNSSRPASAEFLREWEAEYSPNFPVVADPASLLQKTLADSLTFPVAILLDRRMTIVNILGSPSLELLREEVARLVEAP